MDAFFNAATPPGLEHVFSPQPKGKRRQYLAPQFLRVRRTKQIFIERLITERKNTDFEHLSPVVGFPTSYRATTLDEHRKYLHIHISRSTPYKPPLRSTCPRKTSLMSLKHPVSATKTSNLGATPPRPSSIPDLTGKRIPFFLQPNTTREVQYSSLLLTPPNRIHQQILHSHLLTALTSLPPYLFSISKRMYMYMYIQKLDSIQYIHKCIPESSPPIFQLPPYPSTQLR